MTSDTGAHKAVATRFIEAFNTNDWGAVHEVLAPDFVFHHPEGGTVAAGPEGMVAAWSAFKAAVPDGWHPIPIMIAEGDHVAVLLPTYGHFTGEPYHGIPPTNAWLEYGMVNMVRFARGRIVEAWFGMDPLAEKRWMGMAPPFPGRSLTAGELECLRSFYAISGTIEADFDHVTAFGDTVIALGPPQSEPDTKVREMFEYRVRDSELALVRSHVFPTIPPFGGELAADAEVNKQVVKRFTVDVLSAHDLDALNVLVAPGVLVHPTAMPCEAGFFGVEGVTAWLGGLWHAFPDAAIVDSFMIGAGDIVAVRWTARGTSHGPFLATPATGEVVEFTGISMYRIADGLIAEIWEARNTFGMLSQLTPGEMTGHAH